MTETERVAAAIRDAIVRGEFPPGSWMPYGRHLAATLGTSEDVVKAARKVLVGEGLIETVRRKGTRVRTEPPVVIRRRLGVLRDESGYYFDAAATHWRLTRPTVLSWTAPPADIASYLGTTDTLCRDRAVGPEGKPVQLVASWIPRDIAEQCGVTGPITGPGGIYARFEDHGYGPLHWEEESTARMPAPAERRELAIPPGTCLLRLLRITHTRAWNGRVIEVADYRLRADMHRVRYRLGRSPGPRAREAGSASGSPGGTP